MEHGVWAHPLVPGARLTEDRRVSFAERAPVEVPAWAQKVRKVTVLTGAGISTDSGIPDFRGPRGVWTRNPGAQQLSTYQAYVGDPLVRRRSWQARRNHPAWTAEPNAAHVALAELACSRVDTHVITQNIDGLHQKAGTPAARVIEVHGSMSSVVCGRCGGILKSATVMFGQRLDPVVFARAEQAALDCDLFLAIGTTLSVEPAASLCGLAAGAGAAVVIVNADPTPYDELAAEVIREPIGTAVPRITRQLLAAARLAPA